MVAATALFELAIAGRFPARAARAGALLLRLRRRHGPALQPRALQPRPGDRARLDRARAARALGPRSPGGGPRSAGEPRGGGVPRFVRRVPGDLPCARSACAARRSRPAASGRSWCSPSPSPKAARSRSSHPPSGPGSSAVALIGLMLPRGERTLRIGALLYALALLGAYVVPSAVGGNVDRLGALAAGPIAVCALLDATPRWRHVAALALVAPSDLLAAQRSARRLRRDAHEPGREGLLLRAAARRAAHARRRLRRAARADRGRADASTTGRRAASRRHVDDRARLGAPARQLPQRALLRRRTDSRRAPTAPGSQNRRSPTSPCRTRRWTTRARRGGDGSSLRPRAHGPDLREVWRSRHWRLFAVLAAAAAGATPPARLTSARDGLLHARRAVAPAPSWCDSASRHTGRSRAAAGCVARSAGRLDRAAASRVRGSVHVGISFSLARVFDHGARAAEHRLGLVAMVARATRAAGARPAARLDRRAAAGVPVRCRHTSPTGSCAGSSRAMPTRPSRTRAT